MQKSQIRQHIRMLKGMFTEQQLKESSEAIIQRLLACPAIHRAKTILMYYSLSDEVDTHHVLDLLVEKGKTVLLPAVLNDTDIELRRYTSPADLQGGFFDIMEPIGEVFTHEEEIEVAVVPGMGFDGRGNRLGRGKGYYDRLLARLPHTYKIGVCFDFQKMPGIPADEHDIRMDVII